MDHAKMLAQVVAEQSGKEPTLRDLLRVALAAGKDRVSLVRRPSETQDAGLVVVMIDYAMGEVGPLLLQRAAEIERCLGMPTVKPVEQILLRDDSSMVAALRWVDSQEPRWAWMATHIDRNPVLVWMATGPGITQRFCDRLTALGCLTNLQ